MHVFVSVIFFSKSLKRWNLFSFDSIFHMHQFLSISIAFFVCLLLHYDLLYYQFICIVFFSCLLLHLRYNKIQLFLTLTSVVCFDILLYIPFFLYFRTNIYRSFPGLFFLSSSHLSPLRALRCPRTSLPGRPTERTSKKEPRIAQKSMEFVKEVLSLRK